ncbi:MAG: rhomboid family intramembrane serine protease [Saprospiraceae bacterium]
MIRLTDVVKQLLIINVLIYFLSQLHLNFMPDMAMYYPGSDQFKPYQIITHMFMHGSLTHLFFNMFMLFTFGPMLESFMGSKRFLFYYFFCGLGAILTHTIMWYLEVQQYNPLEMAAYLAHPGSVVGASGALFGVLIAFGMYFPDQKLMLLFPPIPLKAKYMVILAIGLEVYLQASESQTQVAHFAHLGGALFGFLIILFWRKTGK